MISLFPDKYVSFDETAKPSKKRFSNTFKALTLGAATILPIQAHAQQKPEIQRLEILIGPTLSTHIEKGHTVTIPYNSDISVIPQTFKVTDANGTRDITTHLTIQKYNENTKTYTDITDILGFPIPYQTRVNPEDAPINAKLGETIRILVHLDNLDSTYINVVQGPNMVVVPSQATMPETPAPSPAPKVATAVEKEAAKLTRTTRDPNSPDAVRGSALFGITHTTLDYVTDKDPFKTGKGFLLNLELQKKNLFGWADARMTTFNEVEQGTSGNLQRMYSRNASAGLHAKVAEIFTIGGELLGGKTGFTSNTTYGYLGNAVPTSFGYNARAGLIAGRYNSNAGFIQAFGIIGKIILSDTMESFNYGTITLDSRQLTEMGFGVNARAGQTLRINFYKTHAEGKNNSITIDNTAFSAEASFGVDSEKRVRPFVKYTVVDQTGQGPDATTRHVRYNSLAGGIRFNFDK